MIAHLLMYSLSASCYAGFNFFYFFLTDSVCMRVLLLEGFASKHSLFFNSDSKKRRQSGVHAMQFTFFTRESNNDSEKLHTSVVGLPKTVALWTNASHIGVGKGGGGAGLFK